MSWHCEFFSKLYMRFPRLFPFQFSNCDGTTAFEHVSLVTENVVTNLNENWQWCIDIVTNCKSILFIKLMDAYTNYLPNCLVFVFGFDGCIIIYYYYLSNYDYGRNRKFSNTSNRPLTFSSYGNLRFTTA